jgi:hypothetical protein
MTLKQNFFNLPDVFKHIIGQITIPDDDGLGLFQALQSGTALAASDRSYLEQNRKGSHANNIVDKEDLNATIFGASMCPASDKMSSSTAEHYDAIGILLILTMLLHHFDTLNTKLPSLSLEPLFLNVGQYLTHNFDLWGLLLHLQLNLNITIHFEWIRGHQDTIDTRSDHLFIDLNTQVDALATDIYNENMTIYQQGAFHSGIVCYHQDGCHVQNITNAVSSRESDGRLLEYYQSKGWAKDSLLHVDWIAMGKFLNTLSPMMQ